MVLLVGKICKQMIKDSEVYIAGSFRVGIIISDKTAVLVGSGVVNLLASGTCIVVATREKPLVLGSARCGAALLMGVKSPVAVGHLKSRSVLAKKVYVQRLSASEAVLSSLCVVDELEVSERTIFADPHTYIKKVISVGEVGYSYKPLG